MGQRPRSTVAQWNSSGLGGISRKGMTPAPGSALMHAEGRLLALCARTTVNEFIRVEVADLACDGIDWELVWKLSRTHGVAPLVYRNLVTICPAALPSSIHESFRRHNQANALLNSLLAKELVTLLEALAAKGVKLGSANKPMATMPQTPHAR